MITTSEWLKTIYLPGYVGIVSEDYQNGEGIFDWNPIEPPVTIFSGKYLTPRGLHIFLSQAGICYVERLIDKGGFDDIDIELFRSQTEEGRLKIVELNQRFRREVGLRDMLQGKMVLTRVRKSKTPVIKLDFDVDNRAISGSMTGVIAPRPMPQINADILRQR